MKRIIHIFLCLAISIEGSSQKIFSIWSGKAPGSENWNWNEQLDTMTFSNDPLIYNVSQPTLTYFPPDPKNSNGTAVIICPGGSFCYLHVNTEGSDLAKWLNQKGIAAFVLQYRLVHSESNNPVKEKNERMKDTTHWRSTVTPVVYLGIQDAKQSILFVREHAKELGIAQNKIGIVGFSAGGTLAAACALDHTNENRPDFVVPVYAFVPDILFPSSLKNPPPLFVVAATDDELHLVPMSINLYNKWLSSGNSAELHIYSKGGHGFGMNKHNQPSDTWIDRFSEWLKVEGFL